MVKVCCVKSCKAFWTPRSNLSFFAFPFENEEMKKKWVMAAEPFGYTTLSKYSAVCNNHFFPDDYSEYAGRRILKKAAVPRIFAPRCPNGCVNIPVPIATNNQGCSNSSTEIDTEPESIILLRSENQCDATTQISSVDFQELKRKEESEKKSCNIFVQTCPRLCGPSDRERELQHQIRNLKDRLRRREKMIKNIKNLVTHLKKAGQPSYDLEQKFFRKFSTFDIELFKNQANNNNVGKNGKTYTPAIKNFAKTLYSYSPRAYKFVRAKINLPHTATLRRWIAESKAAAKQNGMESDKIADVESTETGETELTEAEELQSDEIEELEPTEAEDLLSEEIEEVEPTETEEIEPDDMEGAELDDMEEAETIEIKEVPLSELEKIESIKKERSESIEVEEVNSTEIKEIASVGIKKEKYDETQKNLPTPRRPVLITLPVSVAKTHGYHRLLKTPATMKTIPKLIAKRAFTPIVIARKQ